MVIEPNDVEYYKDIFPFKLRNSRSTESNHILVIRRIESNDEVEIELRWSKRVRDAKDYGPDYEAYIIEED